MLNRYGRVVVAILLAVAASMFVVNPAHADPVPILCTGTLTARYSPPVGWPIEDTVVDITEEYYPCAVNEVVSGLVTGHAKVNRPLNCRIAPYNGLLPLTNEFTYTWPGGGQSTIKYAASPKVRAGGVTTITSVGTVTAGFRQGAEVTRTVVPTEPTRDQCQRVGIIAQQSGKSTLAIVG